MLTTENFLGTSPTTAALAIAFGIFTAMLFWMGRQ